MELAWLWSIFLFHCLYFELHDMQWNLQEHLSTAWVNFKGSHFVANWVLQNKNASLPLKFHHHFNQRQIFFSPELQPEEEKQCYSLWLPLSVNMMRQLWISQREQLLHNKICCCLVSPFFTSTVELLCCAGFMGFCALFGKVGNQVCLQHSSFVLQNVLI